MPEPVIWPYYWALLAVVILLTVASLWMRSKHCRLLMCKEFTLVTDLLVFLGGIVFLGLVAYEKVECLDGSSWHAVVALITWIVCVVLIRRSARAEANHNRAAASA